MLRLLAVRIAMPLGLLFCATNAAAQASRVTATLEGTVRDSGAAAISGFDVKVQNTSTSQSSILTTDKQGSFRTKQIVAGTYDIWVEHKGFAPYKRTGLVVSLGQTVHLDIVLSLASGSAHVAAAAAVRNKPPIIDAYIEEFFLSEALRNEDPGELQLTIGTDSRQRLGSNVILQMEYGLTARLQLSSETAYGVRASGNSEVPAGWSTTSIGLQYEIVRSESPFALSAGISVGVPVRSNAEVDFEPELLAAKTFRRVQIHAGFVSDVEKAKPSFQYNMASAFLVSQRWFPTAEFNGRRLNGKNAFYLTPGVYRHFDHRLEVGIGVPVGVGGVAGRVGIVGKITWEINRDQIIKRARTPSRTLSVGDLWR